MGDGVDIPEGANRRLNRMVAVTVVVLSVAMAIGKIKDDNIVQQMQAGQAAKIDLWSEYQAARIKSHDQQIAATMLGVTPAGRAAAQAASGESRRYAAESAAIKRQALAAQTDYDSEGRRDDQFDLSDGFVSIAVAIAAIAVLVESLPLLAAGWASGAIGLLFSAAGFAGLSIHPDALVLLLS